eukprot:GEMP01000203.1.p1 GENE.GEMP01000203.1~~GEMP01000203.1.p1  ORF type:complete len:1732 (+),score=334.48 GEMP01000203.1:1967-7162(+)
MIRSAHTLMRPYVATTVACLLQKLKEEDSVQCPTFTSNLLGCIGHLAEIHGPSCTPYLGEIIPLLFDAIRADHYGAGPKGLVRRKLAYASLSMVVENTGYVVEAYEAFPALLPFMINVLRLDVQPLEWSMRLEVLRCIGTIGALAPARYHNLLGNVPDVESSDSLLNPWKWTTEQQNTGMHTTSVIQRKASERALEALLKMLRESSLTSHHCNVIQAIMKILCARTTSSVDEKISGFVPILDSFLQVLRELCDRRTADSKEDIDVVLQHLAELCAIGRKQISPRAIENIFAMVTQIWKTSDRRAETIRQSLEVLEQVAPISDSLDTIIPQLLKFLHEKSNKTKTVPFHVLRTLVRFGAPLEEYMHIVMPSVIILIENNDASVAVRVAAIRSLGELTTSFQFSQFSGRIVHPLVRILDTSSFQDLKTVALETLELFYLSFGDAFAIYMPRIRSVCKRHQLQFFDSYQLASALKSWRSEPSRGAEPTPKSVNLEPSQYNLKQAWEASYSSTKDEWITWIRRFALELLRESASPALRACWPLAQVYRPLAKELFFISFLSCWLFLYDQYQDHLVRSLERAMMSPNLPPDVLQSLLNLAAFMDHNGMPLPMDFRTLGGLAEKSHAHAKALYYKELEFTQERNAQCVEQLISINMQLQQDVSARGMLTYAKKHLNIELKESWLEKLHRWEDALEAYQVRQLEEPKNLDWATARMRCLTNLHEWSRLSNLAAKVWADSPSEAHVREMAPLAAQAEFNLRNWDKMRVYTEGLEKNQAISYDSFFYSAILAIHDENYSLAYRLINKSRERLDPELTSLVRESYTRAYRALLRVQQLTALEQIIKYKMATSEETRNRYREMWTMRLYGCQQDVGVWQASLQLRSMVIPPTEDVPLMLKFDSLCRRSGRSLGFKVLQQIPKSTTPHHDPRLAVAYLKNMYAAGFKAEARQKMAEILANEDKNPGRRCCPAGARCYLKLGIWTRVVYEEENNTPYFMCAPTFQQVLHCFKTAKDAAPHYKTWNAWALANYHVVQYLDSVENTAEHVVAGFTEKRTYLLEAVKGLIQSVVLGQKKTFQDILRLVTLWFRHGGDPMVRLAIEEGFESCPLDAWLQIIPQILARLRSPHEYLRATIIDLLNRMARAYPQAVVFPLTVAAKSPVAHVAESCKGILRDMERTNGKLVMESLLVSEELIRISILWHEMWSHGLGEAARWYYEEKNTEAMIQTLEPLHEVLESHQKTIFETSFHQAYRRDLQDAWKHVKLFRETGDKSETDQAWLIYYMVFTKIVTEVEQVQHLDMQYVSPELYQARDLELAVPGTYSPELGTSVVTIQSFSGCIEVLATKRKPRIIQIRGSEGKKYRFLLKGDEDLKLDERVMQLFGLINNLLEERLDCVEKNLQIQRFAVVPLSNNSGLIEWVPRCDTLHTLIKQYRDSRKIQLSKEITLMKDMCQKYEDLPLLQKVEVFVHALSNTSGTDLARVLWLQSSNCEVWLKRRVEYGRSLAVMSMVGYVLGLGDRHPSNLMIHRDTGRVVHIDFGDCFEVATVREKYPEKVPFRLTRMLCNALEVSGVEGNYRFTAERVMTLMRDNKDAVMAMLEAFVYDPLITWRLLPRSKASGDRGEDMFSPKSHQKSRTRAFSSELANLPLTSSSDDLDPRQLASVSLMHGRTRDRRNLGPEGVWADPDHLSEIAKNAVHRVYTKLIGTDYPRTPPLDVESQVSRLIADATSHENLCQAYVGWCPFW